MSDLKPVQGAPVLSVSGLAKTYAGVTALDGVDLAIRPGETVAVVGESGSGKSTLARCITRLTEPSRGTVTLGDVELTSLPKRALWQAYRDIQMVFQDPLTSLNPRTTAGDTVEEPRSLHTDLGRAGRRAEVRRLFEEVRLAPELMDRYPRRLSGGQRQRVSIARALAVQPSVLVLDEPTSALDMSVRGSVLDLLARIQRERDLGYLLISHDLGSVRRLADRVMVMYLGAVLEEGTTEEVFGAPRHPYTKALLSASPSLEVGAPQRRLRLIGETSRAAMHAGCRLSPRCPLAEDGCRRAEPTLVPVSATHHVACPVVENSSPEPIRE